MRETQQMEFKASWRDDYLKWICGFANASEAWGRGIQRIVEACKKGGAPDPVLNYTPGDLWLEFPYSQDYLKTLTENEQTEKSKKTPVETRVKTTQKTTQKIVMILKKHLGASRVQLAEMMGDITEDGVKYQLAQMQKKGLIRRVGPAKGGHWEVLK